MNFDDLLKEKLKRIASKHKIKRNEVFILSDLDAQDWNELIKKNKENNRRTGGFNLP